MARYATHCLRWVAVAACLLSLFACVTGSPGDSFERAIYQTSAENETGSMLTPRGVILP